MDLKRLRRLGKGWTLVMAGDAAGARAFIQTVILLDISVEVERERGWVVGIGRGGRVAYWPEGPGAAWVEAKANGNAGSLVVIPVGSAPPWDMVNGLHARGATTLTMEDLEIQAGLPRWR